MLVCCRAIPTAFSNGKSVFAVNKNTMRSAFNIIRVIKNFQTKFLISCRHNYILLKYEYHFSQILDMVNMADLFESSFYWGRGEVVESI